ncbi:hypothetical protein COCSADRAFT_247680 [Bipolaris sorokiniana ND90Pr]|uniref:Uncharacterized protein n=1 Tax=Cochliobolus sativus (strain ND90Pr / ATCC 201652) TaxID=665912 RepID=M2SC11_COCSN|nr:uncharacterized protein COCSADRAFT_247680 [Bipolaris sorokiniana ND90Pr]EMD60025.1 hypothetical protein COCSADRAFT_247680 [Bipolaris sorokiniana ND90Pr]
MGLHMCSAETKARSVCKLVTATCHRIAENHTFLFFLFFHLRTFGFLYLLVVTHHFFLIILKRRGFDGFMRTIQALVIITLLSLLPTSLSLLLP